MPAPKILIENQNALGKNVEQVTLDTNRVDIQRETTSRFANMIALSSRGLWVDITQWIAYAAVAFAVADLALLLGASEWAVLAYFGLPALILVTCIYITTRRRKTLSLQGFLRILLITIGLAIAVA